MRISRIIHSTVDALLMTLLGGGLLVIALWFNGLQGHIGQQRYQSVADKVAEQHGINRYLFRALIMQESRWNPQAISPKGAIGLGQLMPSTASLLGVDPYDPHQNLEGSARYFAQQLQTFKDVKLALCAYNAGPGKVRELGRCPLFPETQHYVRTIIGMWSAVDKTKTQ